MARWTKKILVFPITMAGDQVIFIEQLRRKIKCEFQIHADPRGLTLTFRGGLEQVRHSIQKAREIFKEIRLIKES